MAWLNFSKIFNNYNLHFVEISDSFNIQGCSGRRLFFYNRIFCKKKNLSISSVALVNILLISNVGQVDGEGDESFPHRRSPLHREPLTKYHCRLNICSYFGWRTLTIMNESETSLSPNITLC